MERELIERIQHGDEAAFAELYELYGEYALRVAAAVTGSSANAADAVQETFIRVYDHIGRFDPAKPFRPWFYRILINECRRLMKKQRAVTILSEEMGAADLLTYEDRYTFAQYEELYKAIGRLKEKQRIPVVLKYLQGFTTEEIADILDLNVNTVKSRLFKARNQLMKWMEMEGERGATNG
ncbi:MULTISPECIES: RNA polymerase sigma factor [Geobacillus]|jgi:RNA polymerase sigma factor (sigma-70 family)|uniref:RNA polymerase ECF-type sigma factor n=1 Tax=Geobacillus thermodenitrificans (strain NG80-2) TaxID=420246 RepID=A4IKH7_GEOTN|nr:MULTISPECIES: sigma-70 family RNA polymerase sigma factor [Geobacillus]ABO65831.1 RNA polymerase ECF-type sigma factor [Geobacillus thermodenitrificans NG80-2]ARA97726.1 RNA polymerase subunit sigma-24 [Geobacillus thermodenitrificans]ARP41540.1 ECF RNA polymerase sigma-E factor [Geobacillus thermodenitrificans]ATO37063.1 RNA polymerase subunit sigma-24 [Geobacillus thermodenitrificans]KQB94566.1 RNA polymerase [Geobacillus sp. PA-3]